MTDAASPPLVSVIVPVWNNPRQLRTCLEALAAQTVPADQVEVMVVDNGSTDETPEVARNFAGVRVLSEPRPGSYIARNTGIRAARGRFIAFTDSDCVPDRGWLAAALEQALARPEVGVFAGPIELFDEDEGGRQVYRDYEAIFSFPQDPSQGNCATANWLSPKALLEAAGGFDEQVKSGADKGMALKLLRAGHPLVFVPGMIINHPVRGTMGALVNKRRRLTGGRWSRLKGAGRLLTSVRSDASETLHRLRKLFRAPNLGMAKRFKIAALVLWLGLVSLFESFRLASGGAAVR
jgi:GT2 family glycosyltransferase